MSMMPSGMQSMDLNALMRMFSQSNSQSANIPAQPIPGSGYQGSYNSQPGYTSINARGQLVSVDPRTGTPGTVASWADQGRDLKFKDDLRSLRHEAGRYSQNLVAANKGNRNYWQGNSKAPRPGMELYGLFGTGGGAPSGAHADGGSQYWSDLLPFTDRYNQLQNNYIRAGGDRNSFSRF